MLSTSEQAALAVFRSFMVNAGEMLCFHGPQLEKHGPTLRQLTEKNLVIKEQFAGGYSLTRAGFEAMAGPRPSRTAQVRTAATQSLKAGAGKAAVKAPTAVAPAGKAQSRAAAARPAVARTSASKPARAR